MPHSKNNFWKVDESRIKANILRRHFKGITGQVPQVVHHSPSNPSWTETLLLFCVQSPPRCRLCPTCHRINCHCVWREALEPRRGWAGTLHRWRYTFFYVKVSVSPATPQGEPQSMDSLVMMVEDPSRRCACVLSPPTWSTPDPASLLVLPTLHVSVMWSTLCLPTYAYDDFKDCKPFFTSYYAL